MKFANLFKKELKEMLTVSTILTMVVITLLLVFMGDAFSGIIEEATSDASTITICDKDNTELTQSLIKALTVTEVDEKTGMPTKYDDSLVNIVTLDSDDYASELSKQDLKNVIVIPKGFTENFLAGKPSEVLNIGKMTSGAAMSNVSTNDSAVELIKESLKQTYLVSSGLTLEQLATSESLVTVVDKTIVDDKISDINVSVVSSLTMMQTMFLPIIVYVLVIFASQMIITAISTEKLDKTLETLLSAPVSRISVLSAKMLAAGVVAALNAVAYMIGFNKMMDGLYNTEASGVDMNQILSDLGLKMNVGDYILLGVQLFLTVLIALSISLVLGALAKDAKSAQTLIMPITFMAMIPYILSMLIDIRTLPTVVKYLVYAIPFTHTFIASENLLYGNMPLFFGGMIYQIVLLIICMGFALKVFTTDKIFTMTIDFNKKSKYNKKKKGADNFEN